MKKLIAAMFLIFTFTQVSVAQEIKERENLTLSEQKTLYNAQEKAKKANQGLQEVQNQIAKNHKMQNQDFIGWQQYYKIEHGTITLYLEQADLNEVVKEGK